GFVGQSAHLSGALLVAEEVLHQAVLERMESDDDQAAAGGERRERLREGLVDGSELAVDGDAQRLEDACRIAARAPAYRGRQRLLDHGEQIGAGAQRRAPTARDHGARNTRRAALLTAGVQEPAE